MKHNLKATMQYCQIYHNITTYCYTMHSGIMIVYIMVFRWLTLIMAIVIMMTLTALLPFTIILFQSACERYY